MGDTGPCGPCTEIFYDHGDHIWGGPPGSPEEDGDRFIEIWNNVFMQFNRHADGTMEPLPKPSVDTGMGIERISAIMQGVHSNYEIDVFQTLIKAAADAIGYQDLTNQSLRVVADHIRSCAFLIVDGVMPSNEVVVMYCVVSFVVPFVMAISSVRKVHSSTSWWDHWRK